VPGESLAAAHTSSAVDWYWRWSVAVDDVRMLVHCEAWLSHMRRVVKLPAVSRGSGVARFGRFGPAETPPRVFISYARDSPAGVALGSTDLS
jgi:hypothetical protein